jgi:hypothetical protein
MSLSASGCASAINSAMSSYISTYPSGNFTTAFVSVYKAYSQAGVLSFGGGVAVTEDDGILTSFFNSFSSYTSDADFAQAMADYWSTCLKTPVPPATALSNDASTKVAALTAAIAASYRTTDTQPYYRHFIQAIEDVAKTIQWTAVLSVPPYSRIETVS